MSDLERKGGGWVDVYGPKAKKPEPWWPWVVAIIATVLVIASCSGSGSGSGTTKSTGTAQRNH